MNERRLYSIILGPHTTEKSVRLASSANQVVLKVARDATKTELLEAIQTLFAVRVVNIQTLNTRGKRKQFKQVQGRRSHTKKAIVRLAEGQSIQFDDFE